MILVLVQVAVLLAAAYELASFGVAKLMVVLEREFIAPAGDDNSWWDGAAIVCCFVGAVICVLLAISVVVGICF